MVVDVLGLSDDQRTKQGPIEEVMNILIKIRQEAKVNGNFDLSDKIRDELSAAGIQLKDSRDGTTDYIIN
jgi:cysteinyl-tRNA synthetase